MAPVFRLPALLLALPVAIAMPAPSADRLHRVTETVTVTLSAAAVTTTVTASCAADTTTSVSTSSINTEEYPTSTEAATATGTKGLNDYAQETGKVYFGTAADIPGPEQQDDAYMEQLNNTHDFGQLTPANYMKVGNSFFLEPNLTILVRIHGAGAGRLQLHGRPGHRRHRQEQQSKSALP